MSPAATAAQTDIRLTPLRALAGGFIYWLAFLLVLEPGNIQRAAAAGFALDPAREALRIGGAALLGALATPFLAALVWRAPAVLPTRILICALGALTASAALIAASCLLAPLLLSGPFPPFWQDFADHLVGNGMLLLLPIGGIMAIAHVLRPRAAPEQAASDRRLAVRTRGGVLMLEPAAIDWIEAQGNYAALHTGGRAHLIRETMTALEKRLEEHGFIRVNRGALVALARVDAISPLANGDATITLASGVSVRAGRRYRAALQTALSRNSESL